MTLRQSRRASRCLFFSNLIALLLAFHSEADRPDLISPQGLERTARAFAFLLAKVDATPRVELEHGARPLRPVVSR